MKISRNKSNHMRSVANFMYDNADKFGLDSKRMYILGYLHDIGDLEGTSDNHEENGFNLLDSFGYSDANFVRCHGLTPDEYCRRYNCKMKDIPSELILLWYADMYVDFRGRIVGFDGRLKDIASRYGENSNVYTRCYNVIDFLRNFYKLN